MPGIKKIIWSLETLKFEELTTFWESTQELTLMTPDIYIYSPAWVWGVDLSNRDVFDWYNHPVHQKKLSLNDITIITDVFILTLHNILYICMDIQYYIISLHIPHHPIVHGCTWELFMEAKKGSTLASKASSARRARCSSELKACETWTDQGLTPQLDPWEYHWLRGFFQGMFAREFFFNKMVVFFFQWSFKKKGFPVVQNDRCFFFPGGSRNGFYMVLCFVNLNTSPLY